nr:hypothetical protein [Mycoplasmopsis bovis]
MIVSLKELNKYMPEIKLDSSIEKSINDLGYEVESITKFSDVEGVKFGYVLDVYKNENSKNLNVVNIKTNSGNITIQTTASNVKKDSWIVAFVEGAKKGEIVFGKKEMAGIVSNGMLSLVFLNWVMTVHCFLSIQMRLFYWMIRQLMKIWIQWTILD